VSNDGKVPRLRNSSSSSRVSLLCMQNEAQEPVELLGGWFGRRSVPGVEQYN
jgi:hypothetical protein